LTLPPTYLFALLAAAGALLVFWALRPALFPTFRPTAVDERIQYYGTDVSLTDDVARLSFWDRMIQPTIDSLSKALTELTPLDYVTRLERRLEEAGRPSGLRAAGFISYRRGHISVLERSGLEARACECYAVVKKELSRLLSDVRYRQGISTVVR